MIYFSGNKICGCAVRVFSALVFLFFFFVWLGKVDASTLDSAPPGTIETGIPAYEVLGRESLGLNSAPTDIRELPDGRILLVAGTQLAIGDGVRWDVFNQRKSGTIVQISGAAVDKDGSIYVGLTEGVAKVEFCEDGCWQPRLQAAWSEALQNPAQPMPQAEVQVLEGEWIWHSLTGPLLSWRPGQPMQLCGYVNTIEHVFKTGENLYASERANGVLSRLDRGQSIPVLAEGTFAAITCSQSLDKNRTLVGTYGRGLRVFDGKGVSDFASDELFGNGWRVNDLCRTEGNFLAAALDDYGIVFLQADGRVVQVLDREIDNRVRRVKKLLAGRGGVVWALWDGGILRVQFPNNLSSFESLFGHGLTTVHPYRVNGGLWLLADGRLYRGVYNRSNRLTRLELDSPTGIFVNALSNAGGQIIAGTEAGAYVRKPSGWELFAPEAAYLRILDSTTQDGRWLFVARDEVGWLEGKDGSLRIAERFNVPNLSSVFNKPVRDAAGRIWLELGIARVACVELHHGVPSVRIFTENDGLPQNWPQLYLNDGAIAALIADLFYRFDATAGRFVQDSQYLSKIPGIRKIFGRPGTDSQGRLWVAADGGLQLRQQHDGVWDRVVDTITINYQPYFPTFEGNGAVWLHAQHRLTRYDPHLPAPPRTRQSALLTQLSVAGGKKVLYEFTRSPIILTFSENSLVAHFLARGNTLGSAVNFEILLEGASTAGWVPVGSTGLANLDHLKEGRYVLHVRPRIGDTFGTEDSVTFRIKPPWFRTPIAYAAYGGGLLLLVILAIWISNIIEHRENVRLERVVLERTNELRLSNLKLGKQMEEIRILTQAIAQSSAAIFITTPHGIIEYVNPRCTLLTGLSADELVRRNIGELRPPPKTSSTPAEIADALSRHESWVGQSMLRHKDGRLVPVRSSVSPILGQDGGVLHHLYLEDDITEWLDDQQRRRRLENQLAQAQKIESVGRLAGGIAHDFNNILTGILGYCELAQMDAASGASVTTDLQEIRAAGLRAKDLVDRILTFSRKNPSGQNVIDLERPVAEALKLIRVTTPSTIEIAEALEHGNVLADATQIHQIIVNLCTNAVHAIADRPGKIEVRLALVMVGSEPTAEITNLKAGPHMRLTVKDTGHGMDPATIERIFDPFFTTKSQGQGTGLGLSIVQGLVAAHRGALQVRSEVGKGTTFDLYFPAIDAPIVQSPAPEPALPGHQEEILLVDDEPMVAEFTKASLIHFGYRPILFSDPVQALATFRASPIRYAAVVTDLTMPRVTGLDLVSAIRTERPEMPAIIMTGFGSGTSRDAIARLPRCILLQKPFSSDDLARSLSKVMNSG